MISPQSLKKSYQTKKRDKYVEETVRKDPVKHAKCLNVTQKVEVYHFLDYESDEQTHINAFMSAMDNMKKAEKIGKQITYKSGYSNFTFKIYPIKWTQQEEGFLENGHKKKG